MYNIEYIHNVKECYLRHTRGKMRYRMWCTKKIYYVPYPMDKNGGTRGFNTTYGAQSITYSYV